MNNSIQKIDFSQEQIDLVRKQVAPQANDNELKLFLYQCQRTGLDPLVRQIYCIHRGGKMTIQTSIDGFRVVAERSGVYAGQDEPVFTEENGKIISCKVTVYKFSANGTRYPAAVGVAYWDEYAQQSPMWTKMRHTMISKCAEALALRKAFPQDLSGLYTTEEMNQADAPQVYEGETYTHHDEGQIPDNDRDWLVSLLETSTFEESVRTKLRAKISTLKTLDDYNKAKAQLLLNQIPMEQKLNLSAKEINTVVNKKTNSAA